MNPSGTLISNLTKEQIDDLKALEHKFSSITGQETILIAYKTPNNESH
ncbi:hypothetical protein [Desulfosporosinus hippei]|uniref:Uncharacterized protein n=1 Tax=Desulfosporosinus hippei DSM 8344 TaxID=1121419 RepID=A0A1G7X3R2_9FIRM|nr:hypothetical protein [Desulfosporosinus hippei]SDG78801.1 hypothetical protein SAMN05443529_106113 [Desulfosporosinus hippei DSM 8344]